MFESRSSRRKRKLGEHFFDVLIEGYEAGKDERAKREPHQYEAMIDLMIVAEIERRKSGVRPSIDVRYLDRWLWLRFSYGMIVNPVSNSTLHPPQGVTWDKLLWGTYVADRKKISTKIKLGLTMLGFWLFRYLHPDVVYPPKPDTKKYFRRQENRSR